MADCLAFSLKDFGSAEVMYRRAIAGRRKGRVQLIHTVHTVFVYLSIDDTCHYLKSFGFFFQRLGRTTPTRFSRDINWSF